MLSRSTSAAISAMGVLVLSHVDDEGPLTAVEVGRRCGEPGPFVAKLLVELSRRGLVRGSRGRSGGYRLAREPGKIKLADVAECFERSDKHDDCPFGFGPCGRNPICPLHRRFEPVRAALRDFLERTTFGEYATSHTRHRSVLDPAGRSKPRSKPGHASRSGREEGAPARRGASEPSSRAAKRVERLEGAKRPRRAAPATRARGASK